ncbi:tyrosine-type recombinase/integrase [Microbispora sp. NPDC049633]|uniref:tyrosine-type recombinase/integrase n=1 Tax=Microbispora sp. NPDC049633 TaxID=3154355 RepID=UPI003435180E
MEPDNLRRSWGAIRKAAGLGDMRFHDLRHTCVTLLLNLGVPPQVVRDIVGHSDIEVTMTIYAHVSLDDKRRALGKLGDTLSFITICYRWRSGSASRTALLLLGTINAHVRPRRRITGGRNRARQSIREMPRKSGNSSNMGHKSHSAETRKQHRLHPQTFGCLDVRHSIGRRWYECQVGTGGKPATCARGWCPPSRSLQLWSAS